MCSLLITFLRQPQYFLSLLKYRTITTNPIITNMMITRLPGTMPAITRVTMSTSVTSVGGVGVVDGVGVGSVVCGSCVVGGSTVSG